MKKQRKRKIATLLLILFLNQLFFPTATYALTGGPSQPEVQSFEPVGTTQMVDVFSGDFNYNIPLMDVDGYPINMAYHSGVSMDQEASWVGLGWNLNPGVISRNMRGVPDDFNGNKKDPNSEGGIGYSDLIRKTLHYKENVTYGGSGGVSLGAEFFGIGFGVDMSLGINYNNYKGIGVETTIHPGISAGNKFKGNFGVALTSGSEGGLTIQPLLSLSAAVDNRNGNANCGGQIGVSAGTTINSRYGMKSLQIGKSIGAGCSSIGAKVNSNSSISFCSPSYIPTTKFPMYYDNQTFSLKFGPDAIGLHLPVEATGYKATQALYKNEILQRAAGYFYLEDAKDNASFMLDFNREKDGSFSKENPTLAIPQSTFDLFSFSGHGTGGMFRAQRSDLGLVSDNSQSSGGGTGDSYGVEIGGGNLYKGGGNINMSFSYSSEGLWKNDLGNEQFKRQKKEDIQDNPLFEPAYFKVVGEKSAVDRSFFPYVDIENPMRPQLNKIGNNVNVNGIVADLQFSNGSIFGQFLLKGNHREKRDKRNTYVKAITAQNVFECLQQNIIFKKPNLSGNMVIYPESDSISPRSGASTWRQPHHISEISVYNTNGQRFVYGIPAYNWLQEEYNFTNAKEPGGSGPYIDDTKGEVAYDPSITETNSAGRVSPYILQNRDFKGIDESFDKTVLPAYAHSYLLTAILSPDYQDVDFNGPTANDLGTYTRIDYARVHRHYKWRVPYNTNRANFNEGLKSNLYDNSANLIYGEKEVWHVRQIEGRNHVAKFYISTRKDGFGVAGRNGGIVSDQHSFKLDSISLFSITDPINPIKTVHFEYDYTLCRGVDNNIDGGTAGKLTLKKLYFTYGSSAKGKYNYYKFSYINSMGSSPLYFDYNIKGYDRWGNYKHKSGNTLKNLVTGSSVILENYEFPYVIQNRDITDVYSSAWSLNKIELPSGGEIEIDYEADDYSSVQDRRAMEMFKICGFGVDNNATGGLTSKLYSDNGTPNKYIFIDLNDGDYSSSFFKETALANIENLYFNCLVRILGPGDGTNKEYIRGYVRPDFDYHIDDDDTYAGTKIIDGKLYGWVRIKTEDVSEKRNIQCNPISKAAWQFSRLYLSHLIYPGSNNMLEGNSITGSLGTGIVNSLIGYVSGVRELIDGINSVMLGKLYSQKVELGWIRLNNLSGYKLGGGCRVKRISLSDQWNSMTGGVNKSYGQEYSYTVQDGFDHEGNPKIISSGVASYEPLLGNEENPFRLPVFYDKKNLLVPNEQFYSEEPFGESFFPAPSVGYSRVSVKTIEPSDISGSRRNGTGKVVHEFYTAKDFPTIVKSTYADPIPVTPSYITNLLSTKIENNLTMSQGFMVELNDMHGKPKAQWNYSNDKINSHDIEDASSGIQYEYFTNPKNSKQISNEVEVITPKNIITKATVGVEVEMVADSRESKSSTSSGGLRVNVDNFTLGIIPLVVVPVILPSVSSDKTQFRSAVISKVINRYGIQKATVAYENGAMLRTENILFDSETGETLLTKTQNEFEDNIFNSTYPAHWVHDGMGPKYKNEGLEINIMRSPDLAQGFEVVKPGAILTTEPAKNYFVPGDEILINIDNGYRKCWVYQATDEDNHLVILDNLGENVLLPATGFVKAKVLFSGRKNMQTFPVGSFTTLNNPIEGEGTSKKILHNQSKKIINAKVFDYKHHWPKDACLKDEQIKISLLEDAVLLFNHMITTGQLDMDDFEYTSTSSQYESNSGSSYWNISSINNSKLKKYMDTIGPPLSRFDFIKYNYYTTNVSTTDSRIGFSLHDRILNTSTSPYSYDPINTLSTKTYLPSKTSFRDFIIEFSKPTITEVENLKNNFQLDHLSIAGTCSCSSGTCLTLTLKNRTNPSTLLDIPVCLVQNQEYRQVTYYDRKIDMNAPINPFINNVQNTWRSTGELNYLGLRIPNDPSSTSNIREDGTYSGFNNYWQNNGTNWELSGASNWVSPNEITRFNNQGNQIESKNALNKFSSTLFGFGGTLPVARAINAKYSDILNENFEENNVGAPNTLVTDFLYVEPCPYPHNPGSASNSNGAYDTTHFHTGKQSLALNTGMYTFDIKLKMDQEVTTSQTKYISGNSDYNNMFSPNPGKYVINAWVKFASGPLNNDDYSKVFIKIGKNGVALEEISFTPSGPFIDGWQRITGQFEIESNITNIKIKLESSSENKVYFDDLRIHPYNSNMESYVYDNKSQRMLAKLDENNYATFYNYDKEGKLVRIKQETEKGIITLKDSKSSTKKRAH